MRTFGITPPNFRFTSLTRGMLVCLFITASLGAKDYPVFIFEKSFHNENLLCAVATLNEAGEFVTSGDSPNYIDYYWLMDGTDYKPTHPMIKERIRKRLTLVEKKPDASELVFEFNDLKELKHDLDAPMIHLNIANETAGPASVEAILQLGPSHQNQKLIIKRIYSDVRTHLGVPTGVNWVELRGSSVSSGKEIVARYEAKD